jgi:GNAT superfamily N-acetyltransferase
MGRLRSKVATAQTLMRRSGPASVLGQVMHNIMCTVMDCDRLDIIMLRRQALRPVRCDGTGTVSCRPACPSDLASMYDAGDWGIQEAKLAWPDLGYVCVLSEVDGQIAGYTWAHDLPVASLCSNLSITVPDEFVYNFDGFTHPRFRGYGLQSIRHRAVLEAPAWAGKAGLLGYVAGTNYASKQGQTKSGYVDVGSIWTVRTGRRFHAHVSPRLRRFGIDRVVSPA